jgi:hypothetical protein
MGYTQIDGDQIQDGTIKNADIASDANIAATKLDLSGVVPKTTTVNGHALSGNVTVTKSDVGLSNVPNTDCTTTSNITDSSNKRFVTDANLIVIGNTSNTNTGDETATTIKNKLGITVLSGSNTGDQDLSGLVPKTTTVNGHALSGNITITKSDISLGNVTNVQQLPLSYLSTDVTLGDGTPSDVLVPSQKAVKTYVDTNFITVGGGHSGTNVLVKNTNTQCISGGVWTRVTFPTEITDAISEFTSNTFTSKSIQTVLVSVSLQIDIGNNKKLSIAIYKDGVSFIDTKNSAEQDSAECNISFPINVVVGTTINIYASHSDGGGSKCLNGNQVLSILSIN